MHLAYTWIVSHLSAKNYRNLWKFDEVLTKTNLLSFFWDTVYIQFRRNVFDLLISQVGENASFIDASDGFSSSFVVQGNRMDTKERYRKKKCKGGIKNFREKQTYEREVS